MSRTRTGDKFLDNIISEEIDDFATLARILTRYEGGKAGKIKSLEKAKIDNYFEDFIHALQKNNLYDEYIRKIIETLIQFNLPEKFMEIAEAISKSEIEGAISKYMNRIYAYRIYKLAILDDFVDKDKAQRMMFQSNLEGSLSFFLENNKVLNQWLEKKEKKEKITLPDLNIDLFLEEILKNYNPVETGFANYDAAHQKGKIIVEALLNQTVNPEIDSKVKEFIKNFIIKTIQKYSKVDINLKAISAKPIIQGSKEETEELTELKKLLTLERIIKDYSSALLSLGSKEALEEIIEIKNELAALKNEGTSTNFDREVDDLSQKIQILRALHEDAFRINFQQLTVNPSSLKRTDGYIFGAFWIHYILLFNQGEEVQNIAQAVKDIADYQQFLAKQGRQDESITENLEIDLKFLAALSNAQNRIYNSQNIILGSIEGNIDHLAKEEFCEYFVNPEARLDPQQFEKLVNKAKTFLTNQGKEIILHPLRVIYSTNLALVAARACEHGVQSKTDTSTTIIKKDLNLALKFLQYAAKFDAKTAARLAISYDPETKPNISAVLYVKKDRELARKYYQQFEDLCAKNVSLKTRYPDAASALPETRLNIATLMQMLDSIESYGDNKDFVCDEIISFLETLDPALTKSVCTRIKSKHDKLTKKLQDFIEKKVTTDASQQKPIAAQEVKADQAPQTTDDVIELENSNVIPIFLPKAPAKIEEVLESLVNLMSANPSDIKIAQEVRKVIKKCCLGENSNIAIKINDKLFNFRNLEDAEKKKIYYFYLRSLYDPQRTVNQEVLNLISKDAEEELKKLVIIKEDGKVDQTVLENLITRISQQDTPLRRKLNYAKDIIIAEIIAEQKRISEKQEREEATKRNAETCVDEITKLGPLMTSTATALASLNLATRAAPKRQSILKQIKSRAQSEKDERAQNQKREIADFLSGKTEINIFNKDAPNLAARLAFFYAIGTLGREDFATENFANVVSKITTELPKTDEDILSFMQRNQDEYQLTESELAKFACALLLVSAGTQNYVCCLKLQRQILEKEWNDKDARTEISQFLHSDITNLREILMRNISPQDRVNVLSQIILLADDKNCDAKDVKNDITTLETLLEQNKGIYPQPLVKGGDDRDYLDFIRKISDKTLSQILRAKVEDLEKTAGTKIVVTKFDTLKQQGLGRKS